MGGSRCGPASPRREPFFRVARRPHPSLPRQVRPRATHPPSAKWPPATCGGAREPCSSPGRRPPHGRRAARPETRRMSGLPSPRMGGGSPLHRSGGAIARRTAANARAGAECARARAGLRPAPRRRPPTLPTPRSAPRHRVRGHEWRSRVPPPLPGLTSDAHRDARQRAPRESGRVVARRRRAAGAVASGAGQSVRRWWREEGRCRLGSPRDRRAHPVPPLPAGRPSPSASPAAPANSAPNVGGTA